MQHHPIGVGIIGSGSVVQGIHLPTLARLANVLAVRHVMDVDRQAATAVAARADARAGTELEDLLADPEVEIVAVCSPHGFHAEHVIAACRAGKRVVLCEKPLATTREQAEEIAAAVRESGTRLVVGAMHLFDPAWVFAERAWGDLPATATAIRSSIVLPFNDRFEAWATEVASPVGVPQRDTSTPEARAAAITARILGLGIHDLPLVRAFLPEWRSLEVVAADLLEPLGYAVALRAGDRTAQIVGSFRDHWLPEWELEVTGPDAVLNIGFSPSYVQAGSGTATIESREGETGFGPAPENGYEREWRHAAALARDPAEQTRPLDALVDDLAFAVQLAEQAGARIRSAEGRQGGRS